jgi:hypothetical protein
VFAGHNLAIVGKGQIQLYSPQHTKLSPGIRDQFSEGITQFDNLITRVNIEERFGYDAQCEKLHGIGNIHLAAGLPLIEHFLSQVYHRISIALYTLFVKCWLDEPPLLAMKFSINGQQSITEEEAQVESATVRFRKVAGVLNKNVTNMFRAETENNGVFTNVDGSHTLILLLCLTEELQRLTLKLERIANDG